MKIKKKQLDEMIAVAQKARRSAYATWTRYRVGASVLASSGRIYPGCNIESPTMILHICAERAAIFNAISHGETRILAACTISEGSYPCGVCRQAIREFGGPSTPVFSLMRGKDPAKWRVVKTSIDKLMPGAHTGATIERYTS